jgi:hypothetical protein
MTEMTKTEAGKIIESLKVSLNHTNEARYSVFAIREALDFLLSGNEITNTFVPPTLSDVTLYLNEIGASHIVDAIEFWHKHRDNGWTIGKKKRPMKNWKLAIQTWVKRKSAPNTVFKQEFSNAKNHTRPNREVQVRETLAQRNERLQRELQS